MEEPGLQSGDRGREDTGSWRRNGGETQEEVVAGRIGEGGGGDGEGTEQKEKGRATFQKAAAAVVLVGNQREREERDLVSRRGCEP